ncbi:hypothetical protein LUZ63_000920 [Rhynchospora breviuscula]|uniref:Late embryogenesis abundant protein LEA-2 subgroup domain-containing protein n=1 Tax=Rhynchospora breviuscula TaxID=2022672 RepID=A0A9Q0HWK4_9POAL|nr:hypothetical protein LUZ63_000920 [Rhynchospora breviuscula]
MATDPTIRPHQSDTEPLLPPPLPCYSEVPDSYLLIPSYPILCLRLRRRPRRNLCLTSCSFCFVSLLSSLLFLLLVFSLFLLLWPSDPAIHVTRLHLKHLHISPPPRASFDLTLTLNLNVRNPDFFALDYTSVVSSVSYRGRYLGSVHSAGGRVAARGESNLEAELRLNSVKIVDELVYLIEDLTKGSVPFDTVTEVEGSLGLIFADIPVKGNISCSLNVNPKTRSIVRQDCYPE